MRMYACPRDLATGMLPFLCLLLLFLPEGGGSAEKIVGFAPDSHELIVQDTNREKTLPIGLPEDQALFNGILFNLFYLDARSNTGVGFDTDAATGAQARARLKEVLQYVAGVLNESGMLDIVVKASQTDGTGALASAGTYFSMTPGFQTGSAMKRLKDHLKPYMDTEEVYVTVDFGYDWYLDTGSPAENQVDFLSVMLHEITHSLGWVSLCDSAGGSQIAPNSYSVWDQFAARRSDMLALFSGNPPAFQGNVADLTGRNIVFSGPMAHARYGQEVPPAIYAPSTWDPGSSMAHWDTGNIVGGAVMEAAILVGSTRRQWAPVDLGALIDIGYGNIALIEGESEGSSEGEAEGIVEGEGTPEEGEGVMEGEGMEEGGGGTGSHAADQNGDNLISLSELLRVIQFFNSGGFHCQTGTEDGYAPGSGGDTSCTAHSSDYTPQDWTIGLSELLRLIQFFNSGGYHECIGTEDGYCPGR